MAKRLRYYTPEPKEFHIGFEYEGLTEDKNWEKSVFADGKSVEYYEENRVRILDKTDFLSLDFNSIIKDDPFLGRVEVYTRQSGGEFAFETKTTTVKKVSGKLFDQYLFEVKIEKRFNTTSHTFWIELKNKAELEKLLSQLK